MSTIPDNPQSNNAIASPAAGRVNDPDEINLLEYVYVLVHYKWRIIGATIAGLVIGLIAAYIKGPEYVSTAVIAPKEADSQKAPSFSGFGALGGLVASQLNLGGNASLDKIEVVLGTKKFNADLIEHYKMLPEIYLLEWPKVYYEFFDSTRGVWKAEFKKPKMLKMGNFLKETYLKKEIEESVMNLTVHSKDSTFSDTLIVRYLDFLNTYLKESTETEAKDNVTYLENRLLTVSDPLIREKLQALIAGEIEKAMLVSKEAFKVIDPPNSSVDFKAKKLYPLVFGFGFFFMAVLLVIFGHAFSSAEKTEEDKKLIERIKWELKIFPGKKRKN